MLSDRVDRTTAMIRSLGRGRVLVGIPAETAFREPEPGEKSVPNNAMLGFIHENGSPAANIPARPFLVPGVQDARAQIGAQLESGVRSVLKGNDADADRTLHAVGLIAQNSVRKRLVTGPFTPLSPKTIAKRKAKGRTSVKPLIDTGQLKNAVTYVVRDGQ